MVVLNPFEPDQHGTTSAKWTTAKSAANPYMTLWPMMQSWALLDDVVVGGRIWSMIWKVGGCYQDGKQQLSVHRENLGLELCWNQGHMHYSRRSRKEGLGSYSRPDEDSYDGLPALPQSIASVRLE